MNRHGRSDLDNDLINAQHLVIIEILSFLSKTDAKSELAASIRKHAITAGIGSEGVRQYIDAYAGFAESRQKIYGGPHVVINHLTPDVDPRKRIPKEIPIPQNAPIPADPLED